MFNKTAALLALTLAAGLPALADFSFANTQKVTGGSMAAMAGTAANSEGKTSFKGQKTAITNGNTTTIIDFAAQTITTINNAQKTYKVQKFGEAGASAGGDASLDVKETGQKKVINGFNASETLVTMDVDFEMGRGQSMKMQAEISIWVSPDVPGASEMHAFFQKNAANFPWAAMMGGAGGNQSIQKAIARLQKKLADLDGMAVEEVIRVKPAGGAGAPQVAQTPQMNPAQQAQMDAAMAKMQEMAKQGGPAGAAAQQAMARMGAMGAPGAPAGGSPSLIELTIDNTAFSTADVADSVFAVPAGLKQIQ